jgi:hypothetical protein
MVERNKKENAHIAEANTIQVINKLMEKCIPSKDNSKQMN